MFGQDKIVLVVIKEESGVTWPKLGQVSSVMRDEGQVVKLLYVKDTFYDRVSFIN